MNLSPPSSQKADARPISFVLDDQAFGSAPVTVNLLIRPEDLSRTDPSRMNVQQTLGGAWVDNFGPGIPQITISGHTGWRRASNGVNDNDGTERFRELNDQVFTNWHEKRKQAVKAGLDPDKVQLVFADALDNFAVTVVPVNFTLRRSKSRPLLCQYQITMSVVDQNVDQLAYLNYGGSISDADVTQSLGLDSLSASIDEITAQLKTINSYIDQTLVVPVRDFMNKTTRLYRSVQNAVRAGDAIAGSLIVTAKFTAQAGYNLFHTLATVANLPTHIRAELMQVAGAYTNIFCVLKNALNKQTVYPDYTPLYGSSNCSSTSGGRPLSPLSGVNPFYLVSGSTTTSPALVTPKAQNAINAINASDPALAPLSSSQLSNYMQDISNGFEVA